MCIVTRKALAVQWFVWDSFLPLTFSNLTQSKQMFLRVYSARFSRSEDCRVRLFLYTAFPSAARGVNATFPRDFSFRRRTSAGWAGMMELAERVAAASQVSTGAEFSATSIAFP